MRDHSKHIEVSKEEALQIILAHCNFTPETEIIRIYDAVGRYTADDITAQWDNPNCLTCRMDSIAVHWDDFEDGMPDTSNWVRGKDWEFANTGIAMPEGFDTAIVVEHVEFSDDDTKIVIKKTPSEKYAGTMLAGSRMKKGDVLVKAGTLITPGIASHILSGNVINVPVIKKPKVAFIPTGNELVRPTGEVPEGKNIESNSVMIGNKIREWGGIPLLYDIACDDWDIIKRSLIKATEEADIVVLNAGSSKGSDDLGIEVLEETGTICYHQINHGPGHHSSFGVLNGKPVIGISGPAGGAGPTTDLYVYPAIMKYYGSEDSLRTVKARLKTDMKGHKLKKASAAKGEERPSVMSKFYSIRQMMLTQAEDGVIEAESVGGGHPGMVDAEKANGYYLMPTGAEDGPAKAGDFIEVIIRPCRVIR